jgi:hypothetical protein
LDENPKKKEWMTIKTNGKWAEESILRGFLFCLKMINYLLVLVSLAVEGVDLSRVG